MGSVIKLRNIKRALALKPNRDVRYSLSGRISNFRSYKTFNFIELVDGSTKNHLQLVVDKSLFKKPELGSYLTCHGSLVTSQGKKQPIEFRVDDISYIGTCNSNEYPLSQTNEKTSKDWYRRLTHLRPRTAQFGSLLRVRSELELAIHMIMKQMDFFRVHAPSLSSNDSEASSDLFIVKRTKINKIESNIFDETNQKQATKLDIPARDEEDGYDSDYSSDEHITSVNPNTVKRSITGDDYFRKDVFLVTSAQLHLENLAGSLSRVYSMTTAFRAENSISTKHLSEFLMFEAEEANLTKLETLMSRVESVIKFVAQFLSEVSEYKDDFNSLVEENSNIDLYKKIAQETYIQMKYSEALDILKNKTNFTGNVDYGCDIGRKHEKELLNYCNNVPIFITNYPKELKAFYMKCDQFDKEAECFDLIVPWGGEVCGGSLREDNYDKLLKNLTTSDRLKSMGRLFSVDDKQENENKVEKQQQQQQCQASFDWYLDSRRYGSFPHGGFGVGIERLLQALLGIRNIKDTTAFPRWTGHCPM